MIRDSRKLNVYRITVIDGEVVLQPGAVISQGPSGEITCLGLWSELVAPTPEDAQAQAEAKGISPLEWIRQKLVRSPYLKVSVM